MRSDRLTNVKPPRKNSLYPVTCHRSRCAITSVFAAFTFWISFLALNTVSLAQSVTDLGSKCSLCPVDRVPTQAICFQLPTNRFENGSVVAVQKDEGLLDVVGLPGRLATTAPLQIYGWLDVGYTSASTVAGRLAVAPVPNRYGDTVLFNQAAIVVTKPLRTDELSWGFYSQLFAGSDASLLQGPGDIHSSNPLFGMTIRQLNTSVHLPLLTAGGIDVVLGRQGTWMCYESYMAPGRPLYSLSYQWNFAEDGSDTGVWTTWHATSQLDLRYAMTLGSNTFFELRGSAPCHLTQVVYRLDDEWKTVLTGSWIIGNGAIGNVVPYATGRLDSVVELRAVQQYTRNWKQIVQANLGIAPGIAVIGTGEWYGVFGLTEYAINRSVDAIFRYEWFDDVNGTRTGIATTFNALTVGLNYRPKEWISIRPEIRGDMADRPAYGHLESIHRQREQLTLALECLVRF